MDLWTLIGVLAHLIAGPVTAGHALLYKRDSRAAFGWVSACLLFPLLGPAAYGLFGINRVHSKARALQSRSRRRLTIGFEREAPFVPTEAPLILIASNEPNFGALDALSSSVTRNPLVAGNRIVPLVDGEEAYPAMLTAIHEAVSSVWLMTYILDADVTGDQFVTALAAAVARGLDVRVVVDGFGERYSSPVASKVLKAAGVPVVRFLPPKLIPPSLHVNLRNHRKLLVADGNVAFAGGMNIGDRHLARDPLNTRATQDLHFEFRGPIVDQLADIFRETWEFVTDETLDGGTSDQPTTGNARCRAIIDGPDDNLDKLEIVLIGAISSARNSVTIMTPYFLPSRELISALKIAALKGVAIRVIVPEKSNLPYVQWATQNLLGELLQQGIQILRQAPPFSHAKLAVVDSQYSIVGSANIDARSLRLNFELGIEVVSEEFATGLLSYVELKIKHCRPYTLEEVDGRSLPIRLRDAFFWLFQPYL